MGRPAVTNLAIRHQQQSRPAQAGPIPPNPAELVARKSLDDIFAVLREQYDYILVDTAPVGLVTDTMQISRITDATIYVCRADYTAKESFGLINGLNNEKKLSKMSIVIIGIDMSKKKYGYYYGYVDGIYGKYARYTSYGKVGNMAATQVCQLYQLWQVCQTATMATRPMTPSEITWPQSSRL
jgi:Mrp family chromosome partitioning ATPase